MFKRLTTNPGLVAFILLIFACEASCEEVDLNTYEKSIYSRNGEDGVIAKIFQLIGSPFRYCVELGAADGETNSSTLLLRLQGWTGLLLDRSYEIPKYNLHKEFITADNINSLLKKYNTPDNFDLLLIDIGYNDFHAWKSIDNKFKPSVVMIGYNGTHLPSEDKVAKYRPYFCGSMLSNYYGASILALYQLGRSKGYSLVYAEKNGVNLFFILDEVLKKNNLMFKNQNDVEKIYRYPTNGMGPNGGRPQDPKNQENLPSSALLK